MPKAKRPKDAEEYKKSPYGFQRPLNSVSRSKCLQAGQTVDFGVAGFALHDLIFSLFVSKADGGDEVGAEVDGQDHGNFEGQGEFCC